MAVSSLAEVTRYRWSSDDDADRFSVENPAAGKVITVVQGASRVIVQKGVADTFVNQLAKGVKALKVGAGNDPAARCGGGRLAIGTARERHRVPKYGATEGLVRLT